MPILNDLLRIIVSNNEAAKFEMKIRNLLLKQIYSLDSFFTPYLLVFQNIKTIRLKYLLTVGILQSRSNIAFPNKFRANKVFAWRYI